MWDSIGEQKAKYAAYTAPSGGGLVENIRESSRDKKVAAKQAAAVYGAYGLAMSDAQHFEAELRGLIVVCRSAGFETAVCWADMEALTDEHRRKTLGQLLTNLKARISFREEEATDEFAAALERRNFLAHHFFLERKIDLEDASALTALGRELIGASDVFQRATARTRAMRISLSLLFGIPLEMGGLHPLGVDPKLPLRFELLVPESEQPKLLKKLRSVSASLEISAEHSDSPKSMS